MKVLAFSTGLVAATLVCQAAPVTTGCPASAELSGTLGDVDLSHGSRTVRFSTGFPAALYRKAIRNPGKPVAEHNGDNGYGVLVAELPVESIWKALNDEDRHAGRLPVEHSEVIEGTPRGESRVLFQYFDRWGIGRWWVSRVEMNDDLYSQSDGALWELYWEDGMATVDPKRSPMNEVSSRLNPIKESHGAWLLVPVGANCTVVEYFNRTDPGGFAGMTQWLVATRSIRSTLDGVARMAAEHAWSQDPTIDFVRPDGTPLD